MTIVELLLRKFDRAHRQVPVAIGAIVLLGSLLIGVSWVAFDVGRDRRKQQAWHVHTLDVLLTADEIEIASLNLLRGERGYLLTGNQAYLQPYAEGRENAQRNLARLASLTRDNPVQNARAATLRDQFATYRRHIDHTIALKRQGRGDEALLVERTGTTRRSIQAINTTLADFERTERGLLSQRARAAEMLARNHARFLAMVALVGVFVLIFATLAVIALRQAFSREAVYRRELRRLADTDELTGIANRRELMAGLDRAIASARRNGSQLALAIVDIDHFKAVNDTFGHPAGDEVIRKVARTALATIRGCDLVGRIGGEEFAIVLPGAGTASAYAVCERLRERIHADLIELPDGNGVQVTISTGIARLTRNDIAATLVERADQALYEAKSGGRDQVRLAA